MKSYATRHESRQYWRGVMREEYLDPLLGAISKRQFRMHVILGLIVGALSLWAVVTLYDPLFTLPELWADIQSLG